ncbi:polyprotein [Reed chlorotic stripe virus]|uniref:Genome polyprotein n=1 Tax=Common reed chlorotic stripe virus TaxID=2560391 RepID=A0A219YMC7_9POTY|nr:polyprotein [Reed chlorotic stripe virus]AQT26513.1 polyprotein [Reed chlorotic stripe virus]
MALPTIYIGSIPVALDSCYLEEPRVPFCDEWHNIHFHETYLSAEDYQLSAAMEITDYDYKVSTAFARFEATEPIPLKANTPLIQTTHNEAYDLEHIIEPYAQAYHKLLKKKTVRERVTADVDSLMRFVRNNMRVDQTVEVIDKRVAAFKREGRSKIWRAQVIHLHGHKTNKDLAEGETINRYIDACATKELPVVVTYGDSGKIYKSGTSNIVVRGVHDGKVYDAREYIPTNMVLQLEHFSERVLSDEEESTHNNTDSEDLLQMNIASGWLAPVHICDKDHPQLLDDRFRDEFYHGLFQCIDLRCLQCIMASGRRDGHAIRTQLAESNVFSLIHSSDNWRHISRVLTALISEEHMVFDPPKLEGVHNLIKGEMDGQFVQLRSIVSSLCQASGGDNLALRRIHEPLLELARHLLKNKRERTEDHTLFRNTYVPRPLQYSQIIGDNLIAHGDQEFWGTNSVAMMSVYQTYYRTCGATEITSIDTYRKNPNGSRKIATKLLTVKRSPSDFRGQLTADRIPQGGIANHCIARTHNTYKHAISCVTDSKGSPIESDIILPAAGFTFTDGEDLLRMPRTGQGLCVAKNGYCYLNIFMNMFTQVKSLQAQGLAKRINAIAELLGPWPTMLDVATSCMQLALFYPTVAEAGLPRILVDHTSRTLHVADMFGSLTTGYHVLKAELVRHLMLFADPTINSELKNYRVGGRQDLEPLKALIKASMNRQEFVKLLDDDPYMLLYATLSPRVLWQLHVSGSYETAMRHFISKGSELHVMVGILDALAHKSTQAKALMQQYYSMRMNIDRALEFIAGQGPQTGTSTLAQAQTAISILRQDISSNEQLLMEGFTAHLAGRTVQEKMLEEACDQCFKELPLLQKSLIRYRSLRSYLCQSPTMFEKLGNGLSGTLSTYTQASLVTAKRIGAKICSIPTRVSEKVREQLCLIAQRGIIASVKTAIPNVSSYLGLAAVVTTVFSMLATLHHLFVGYSKYRRTQALEQQSDRLELIALKYNAYCIEKDLQAVDDFEDLYRYIAKSNEGLAKYTRELFEGRITLQAKTTLQVQLEKAIAIAVVIMMYFDSVKSDVLYNTLSKLKGVFSTLGQETITLQSDERTILDQLMKGEEESKTVQFSLVQHEATEPSGCDETFQQFWSSQVNSMRTTPHFWSNNKFLEFTRETADQMVQELASSNDREFTVRGPVGSGKSTALPFKLTGYGRVLVLEPTRPLARNVWEQLNQPIWGNLHATLKMRHDVQLGDPRISVMTTGFAFQHLAHNLSEIKTYQYIMFDECHVPDAYANALVSLLRQAACKAKLLFVSATPVGREAPFKPPHPVNVISAEAAGIAQFAKEQGSGSKIDATAHGCNILVYVASYNDVDTLSTELTNKQFQVTKVDGRTMKKGVAGIDMHGTPNKPHFCVATNIIENGVTLDVDVVVDFGQKITPSLDSDNRIITCQRVAVTTGERIQRGGRVGRNKPGTVIKLGKVQTSAGTVPEIIATEAAFLAFAHNLPLMTVNVDSTFLANCTRRQAQTMTQFDLPIYLTKQLVHYDGTVHPKIMQVLQPYTLRNCAIKTSNAALPWNASATWLTVAQYNRLGAHTDLEDDVKIPFYVNDVPPKVYRGIWNAVLTSKPVSSTVLLRSIPCNTTVVTLQADPASIGRSLLLINELIASEQIKQHEIGAVLENPGFFTGTLSALASRVRNRYIHSDCKNNIQKLQEIKAQLEECKTFTADQLTEEMVKQYSGLGVINLQSKEEIIKHLNLEYTYDGRRVTQDILLGLGILGGTALMLWEYIKYTVKDRVYLEASDRIQGQDFISEIKARSARLRVESEASLDLEGYGKRARQKQRYQQQRERKETHGTTRDFEDGLASYGKRKAKGKQIEGTIKNRFVNMYGFAPEEYQLARFLDPVTGYTVDRPVQGLDFDEVRDAFEETRTALHEDSALTPGNYLVPQTVRAYLVNTNLNKAIQFDITQHDSDLQCQNGRRAGFTTHDGELRQTSRHQEIEINQVPPPNAFNGIQLECKSVARGPIDITPFANHIVHIETKGITRDGNTTTMNVRGVAYGEFVVAPSHAFKEGMELIKFKTSRGDYISKIAGVLQMTHLEGRDMLIVKIPSDMPIFSKKLKFRGPTNGENIALIDSTYTTKEHRPLLSAVSATYKKGNSLWAHSISTQKGHCGCPLVAMKDLMVVGIHTAAHDVLNINYYTTFPLDFEHILESKETKWVTRWCFNPDLIDWGGMKLSQGQEEKGISPDRLFKALELQSKEETETWFTKQINPNLKQVGTLKNNLITKHIITGPNHIFHTYLQCDERANKFFTPLLGNYLPSRLNKDAFIKDISKYATPIPVGNLDIVQFQVAIDNTIRTLSEAGITECSYVTDSQAIFRSLNLDAATGVQYGGKKSAFFEGWSEEKFELYHKMSMKHLFEGKMGIWNGSLKAELRPLEKVSANKTRVYTAAPVDTLLAAKTCVDDFNNQFYAHHLEGPWTVGITKFRLGWDKFLNKLPEGWLYCHADGSQFDSSLTPYLLNAVCLIRLHFMEDWEEGAIMLQNLYTQIVYTPIATPDGSVIKKFRGNNSGQPSTVVDNTMMVMLAMEYAKSFTSHEGEWVRYFANGDDLVIALRPGTEDFLENLAEHFGNLGLKYTFANRTKEREDIDFMSHAGIKRNGVYIPKLDQERIAAILEWERSPQPENKLSALVAALVEAYGYDELENEIRRFYAWLIEQHPYQEIARNGKAPYLSHAALKNLYENTALTDEEIREYMQAFIAAPPMEDVITLQADITDGDAEGSKGKGTEGDAENAAQDIVDGSHGGETYNKPKVDDSKSLIRWPKIKGKDALNKNHLAKYKYDSHQLTNKKSTQEQFENWYTSAQEALQLSDTDFQLVMNGFMVWCIHNGTSAKQSGSFKVIFDDGEQTYPIQAFLAQATPTLRANMMHFSDVAQAYIRKQNETRKFMPRWGILRGLHDISYAEYAFDFYEITNETPDIARELHTHMKAAALRNSNNKTLGLDGNVTSNAFRAIDHEVVTDNHPTIQN